MSLCVCAMYTTCPCALFTKLSWVLHIRFASKSSGRGWRRGWNLIMKNPRQGHCGAPPHVSVGWKKTGNYLHAIFLFFHIFKFINFLCVALTFHHIFTSAAAVFFQVFSFRTLSSSSRRHQLFFFAVFLFMSSKASEI
jgi:hypothetical protein